MCEGVCESITRCSDAAEEEREETVAGLVGEAGVRLVWPPWEELVANS